MSLKAVEREIKKLQSKIAQIDTEIDSLMTGKTNLTNQLAGLEKALTLIGKQPSTKISRGLRPDSEMSKIRDILLEQGHSLHVNEIVDLLGTPGDKNKALSLSGSLGSYANKNRIFTRTAPNTFDLLNRAKQDNEGDEEKEDTENKDI